jgi:hypothetical protein
MQEVTYLFEKHSPVISAIRRTVLLHVEGPRAHVAAYSCALWAEVGAREADVEFPPRLEHLHLVVVPPVWRRQERSSHNALRAPAAPPAAHAFTDQPEGVWRSPWGGAGYRKWTAQDSASMATCRASVTADRTGHREPASLEDRPQVWYPGPDSCVQNKPEQPGLLFTTRASRASHWAMGWGGGVGGWRPALRRPAAAPGRSASARPPWPAAERMRDELSITPSIPPGKAE